MTLPSHLTGRDGIVGAASAALAALAVFVSGTVGGVFNDRSETNYNIESGGGDISISAPSPAELACPKGWKETDRNVLTDANPPRGYVVCDAKPYSLSLFLVEHADPGKVMFEYGGGKLREITDPTEMASVLAEVARR